MFETERFIEDCRAALAQGGHCAVEERVARAVSEPGAVLKGLGEPTRAGVNTIYHAPDLTILNLVWGPHMTLLPHDHRMWAVIGIYTGREDNIFWRPVKGDPTGRVEACGAKALSEKQCAPLGKAIIHSVTNPIRRLTAALHVYGGDFFNEPRSEWDSESLAERRYDPERIKRLFEESNGMPATGTRAA
jgi:predicted metal-dependent enzyme (double-stranded beta helix superfamily)